MPSVGSRKMDASDRKRWLRAVVLLGGLLCHRHRIGEFASHAASNSMREIWNRWPSCVRHRFRGHIGYEHFRLGNSPRITALHTSIAVAVAAFALAFKATSMTWGPLRLSTPNAHRPGSLAPSDGCAGVIVALVVAAGLTSNEGST